MNHKKSHNVLCFFIFASLLGFAQAVTAQVAVADQRTGCKVRFLSVGPQTPRVTWDGPCVGGFAQGTGTVQFDSGVRYVGEMRDGWRNGAGRLTMPDGGFNEGRFVNSQLSGPGASQDAAGNRIEGSYSDGVLAGACRLMAKNGDRADGQCVDDDLVNGTYREAATGWVYQGGLKEGRYHGNGVNRAPNDMMRHEGVWSEGKLVKGRVVTRDGSYRNWENGQFVGDAVVSDQAKAQQNAEAMANMMKVLGVVVQIAQAKKNMTPGNNPSSNSSSNSSSNPSSNPSVATGSNRVRFLQSTQDKAVLIETIKKAIKTNMFGFGINYSNGRYIMNNASGEMALTDEQLLQAVEPVANHNSCIKVSPLRPKKVTQHDKDPGVAWNMLNACGRELVMFNCEVKNGQQFCADSRIPNDQGREADYFQLNREDIPVGDDGKHFITDKEKVAAAYYLACPKWPENSSIYTFAFGLDPTKDEQANCFKVNTKANFSKQFGK
jgi:hypothetical protein